MKYFYLPLRFVEPTTDSDANGPHIVDAQGSLVAKLFWPCHPGDETETAEQETYSLGRAMAAAADILPAQLLDVHAICDERDRLRDKVRDLEKSLADAQAMNREYMADKYRETLAPTHSGEAKP